ncbi:surface lipoprotein assembly modifier [Sphingomonas sp. MG17]|uniref:Surface lipoprotein assembly modifier n=1 Tax=Sphingomonas tagetis TaxID=2949092 RepID=A0A9X2KM70_9SPHN|nr:surface lipoprotein assembly modifier [Sphingomonas tagetis]MCP3732279.1 surface lipoprotein assembly modifier [Sphingomonas tagetis]
MRLAALALGTALLAPGTAQAQLILDQCVAATCKAKLTPDELLGEVQLLIQAKRYDEARPMLAALATLPQYRFETRYLTGMVAAATGDHKTAIAQYQAILSDDPNQTRVRLELGRSMLALGRPQSADRQFKMAQQDAELPSEIARTIRTVRDIIRANRMWRVDVNVGFAPDSNINGATSADSITILWGGIIPLDMTLDERAKATSGIGQTASVSAGMRLPVGEGLAMIADLDTTGTNYVGSLYDDYQVQLAAGGEVRLSDDLRVTVQALGAQRWYAGTLASRQAGAKAGLQLGIGDRQRVGMQLDARRTQALFDSNYDGWQLGAYASYERALSRSIVASVGVFGRRDLLAAQAYSSKEYGASVGVGGELPMGFNAAVSGTVSRATFDAPLPIFSWDARQDMRYTARATLGNRKFAWMGFSPEVSVAYTLNDSSIPYFAMDRVRVRFGFARYF